MASKLHEVYIFYGSQTGQAETIAGQIHEEAIYRNYVANIYCLKDEGKAFDLLSVKCAVFVCSTTGDGDPPENARKFIRNINRKTLPSHYLAHLRYALLGLGDTNYSTFCGGPKKLEKALKARGAVSFYKSAFADDGTDLEMTVEPWIDDLFPALEKHFLSSVENLESNIPMANGESSVADDEVNRPADSKQSSDRENEGNGLDICKETATPNVVEDLSQKNISEKNNMLFASTNALEILDISGSPLLQSSLSEPNLTLPPLVHTYLEIKFFDDEVFDVNNVQYQNGASFPIASSEKLTAELTNIEQMTSENAVKKALEVEISLEKSIPYQPGDSFAICCENNEKEVEWLIHRLSCNENHNKPAKLFVKEGTTKKNSVVPPYIPQPFTMKYAFRNCLEIRAVPKKPLLRSLAECTSDPQERRLLQELCSRQGSEAYMRKVRQVNLNIIDLLATFQTCNPSFETLAQQLPRLQLRRYSIATSPLTSPNKISFVFNVVRINDGSGRTFSRNGVCTGHLEKLFLSKNYASISAVQCNITLEIFLTKSTGFCLPDNILTPIVMIGPGTGVAPFVGFLKHREGLGDVAQLGQSWLFYGCRHSDRDFLYKNELERLERIGVLSRLVVAFSRDSPNAPKYVQDNLRLHSSAVVDLLFNKNAVFYVCGDARNMAKDVRQCLVEIIASENNCDEQTATNRFKQVLTEKRYREDIWC